MTKKRAKTSIILLCLVLGLLLGYWQSLPPKAPKDLSENPITLEEAKDQPDLQLMLSHIREMAAQVHSVGSPGLAQTQGYLMRQIEAMDFPYTVDSYELSIEEVQDLLQLRAGYHGHEDLSTPEEIRRRAGLQEGALLPLHNILVHLDAAGTEETIIFMAHTDSVIEGPGAFDDIVSVAALLEGLRAMQGKELRRDVLFLFTDGEEQGLLGAAKFIQNHPEYQERTRLVVNLEARGNAGTLVLFQTSPNNLGLMDNYRQAVPHPFSTSIATAVYQTMPNDTDLTHFLEAGYPGINLAAIDGAHAYHTALDNYDTFSRDSARHYLDSAVGLVTHLALSPDVSLEAKEDAVHFPLMPGKLVLIPQRIANALAWAALACCLLLLGWLLYKGQVQLVSLATSLSAQLIILALSGGLSFGLLQGMYLLNEHHGILSGLLFGRQANLLFVLLLLVFTGLSALFLRILWRHSKHSLSHLMGLLLLPALLGLVCVHIFPAASYLFSLPVMAGLLVVAIRLLLPPLVLPFAALSIILALLLYTPVVSLLYIALGVHAAFLSIPLALLPLSLVAGQGVLVSQGSE